MYVYLGNLSVEQIESRDYGHGVKFSEDEREFLENCHHPAARFENGESGWHMFDIPRFLAVSPDDTGRRVIDVFAAHGDEIVPPITVGYAYEGEGGPR